MMSSSKSVQSHHVPPLGSDANQVTSDVPIRPSANSAEGDFETSNVSRSGEDEEMSGASLLGNQTDQHPMSGRTSVRKANVEVCAEKLNPIDGQPGRSYTCYKTDGWASEVLFAIFSIGCLIAIVAVLIALNGRRNPRLSFGITLNSIISILSPAAKSSLMFGIASAIGQCKWDWFNDETRHHALRDLEHIDEASRGPLGALRMLFTPTRSSIASMGAIVTLLMLAVDPFVQQILRYQEEPNAVASKFAWTEQVLAPTFFFNNSDPPYYGAINSALWNDDLSYERQAHCPTGNCTYPVFPSMGLCMGTREVPLDQITFGGSACTTAYADIAAAQVVFDNLTDVMVTVQNLPGHTEACTASFWGDNTTSLPWEIQRGRDVPSRWSIPLDFTGSMEPVLGGEESILGIRSPLLALGRIRLSSPSLTSNTSMTLQFDMAEQVAFAFCANDYEVTVDHGVTSTSMGHVTSPGGFSYSDNTTVFGRNATCWTSGSDQETFSSAEIKHASGGNYVASTSSLSFCTENWGWGVDIASRLTSRNYFGLDWNPTWYITEDSGINNKDVLQQLHSRSLPDISRSITASLNALFRKHSTDRASGSYIEYQTVVRVQWAWLALPLAVEMFGFVFLLLVVFRDQTRGNPWKSSILAALFHGLDPNAHDTGNLDHVTSMEREAMKIQVKLDTSDEGKRFL
ncbi:uncharacterized protein LA080_005266 [Diaporthe eres]|nr:uncharacterized protein LA080_005266 [Diaporthe eres]